MFKIDAPEDVIKHVKVGTFKIKNPQISQCIDGRRTQDESNFGISIPGGGLGQLVSMLSVIEETRVINMPDFREKCLNILLDTIGGENMFSFHTDDNCCSSGVGCGHLKLILNKENRKEYLLSDESAEFIENVMRDYSTKAKINVLRGEHGEVGVLIVKSLFHSVHPNINGHQLFIYTPELARLRNVEIAKRMYDEFFKGTGMSLTPDSILDMLQRKTDLHFKETISKSAPSLIVYETKHFLNGEIKYLRTLGTIKDVFNIV